jgi:diacylglycerol kinase family enzyme
LRSGHGSAGGRGGQPRAVKPGPPQRLAALAALALLFISLVLVIELAIGSLLMGLFLIVALAASLAAAWYGVLGAGPARFLGFGVAALILGGTLVALLAYGDSFAQGLLVVGLVALAVVCARNALRTRVPLPDAAAPEHPVLFYNPKSGGGKAEQFDVAEEARKRGIEPIELRQGDDLKELVRDAVGRGADGLAMAGGDGSQAVVAAAAAEADIPYACIPAGTRNHFALDLGVDRDDVVGALDAFVDGGERMVDLAEVNGRIFVNNVSLGLYAEAVQREGYREAKLRTLLATVPDMLGPDGDGLDLRWTGPGGHRHAAGTAILVSNNRYRLGRAVGSGTRPRIDDGLLGITVASAPTAKSGHRKLFQRPWREWSQADFVVESERPVPAGIDGEAASLDSPLRFRIRPGVLRVRISKQHPGASPSAAIPEGVPQAVRSLGRIVLGRRP